MSKRLDRGVNGYDVAVERGIQKSTSLPFTADQMEAVAAASRDEFGERPFYVYDAAGIVGTARGMRRALSRVTPGYRNFFAVKATPTPGVMELLRDEGQGADASSFAELRLANGIGITGENIMFTSNNTPAHEFQEARRLGAIINLDDITHIPFLEQHAGIPPVISFRYNPGSAREGNSIIGNPEEAKYGLTRGQVLEAYDVMKAKGVKRFGLHTMVASNELRPDYFVDTARMVFDLAAELKSRKDVDMEFVNLGGGFGIPYRPEQDALDMDVVADGISGAYDEMVVGGGLNPFSVVTESGRFVTGPHGYLIARAQHFKHIYREYAGVNASMADLMRPGMYEAYHHITILGKEDMLPDTVYDVVGGLCENNDKFAIQRPLPRIDLGDLLAIHDAGAHGRSMTFNYNGKLRPPEWLMYPTGEFELIRRAETLEDLNATLRFTPMTIRTRR